MIRVSVIVYRFREATLTKTGVMGGVNAAPDYVREVKIGEYPSGMVTNQTKQGGIISIVCTSLLRIGIAG